MNGADPFARLRSVTPARIGLGRCGNALPTRALLEFQLAHARARDAVHETFSPDTLVTQLTAAGLSPSSPLIVHSQATDRHCFLQRPDLGRRLCVSDTEQLSQDSTKSLL